MVLGFFKKKTRVTEVTDPEIDTFMATNLRAIINKDRERHGQPYCEDDRILIVDLMFNEVANSAMVWIKGRDFQTQLNRQELAVVGYLATYFTHTAAIMFRLSKDETTIIVDEVTSSVLPDMFSKNPNFDKAQFLNDTHSVVRDAMLEKYTSQKMLDAVGSIFNQCVLDLDGGSKEYEGRQQLLGLMRLVSDNVESRFHL